MSTSYYLAVPEDKITYYLGSPNAAISTFPLLLNRHCENKSVILYSDETVLGDIFDGSEHENDDTTGSAGHREVDYSMYTAEDSSWVKENEITRLQLDECCEVLSNYIKPYIYTGNKMFINQDGYMFKIE